MQVIKCNSNVMAITCHIFKCNALHYNYVMRKNAHYKLLSHVIHYNYVTITITIKPGLVETVFKKINNKAYRVRLQSHLKFASVSCYHKGLVNTFGIVSVHLINSDTYFCALRSCSIIDRLVVFLV